MDEIIVISICEKAINKKRPTGYEFHFKGYFRGERINKINVKTQWSLSLGEEYLLLLSVDKVISNCLNTELIKSTELKKINFPN
ncbi:hypothetical protein [Halobacteriovorax sp. JY17]|uniref:hypothetical protein n=1 Tax=Halobacteriovorax sp. JY17 TaxID=2014617 RepID=UPI000C6590E9|nr:hypothetical protein [Halobacteriovorax sp. JY17]PIK14499.1 MAG: hypothetical protein CES88_09140 [Halobacteriovorax sp. JY17]